MQNALVTCTVTSTRHPIGFAGGRHIYEPEPPNPRPIHRFPAMVREMDKRNAAWSAGNKALFEYQLAKKRGDVAAAEIHGTEYDRQADVFAGACWKAQKLEGLIQSFVVEMARGGEM